jgi:hypothetical protein
MNESLPQRVRFIFCNIRFNCGLLEEIFQAAKMDDRLVVSMMAMLFAILALYRDPLVEE